MKKAIFPIDVEIGYNEIHERDEKVNLIKELLTFVTKSDDKVNDLKKMNRYFSILKGEVQPRHFYVSQFFLSLFIVLLMSVIILDVRIKSGSIVSASYIG